MYRGSAAPFLSLHLRVSGPAMDRSYLLVAQPPR
jgi:hypothetical protein